VSTDLDASPAALVERYASRWAVEVLFEEARQVAGVGHARNRTRRAVERTVPFGLLCVSLVVCWYALCGQPTLDVAACRARAPWYRTKQHRLVRRHAHRAPPHDHRRPISARSAGHAHPSRNPPDPASLGCRRSVKCETPVSNGTQTNQRGRTSLDHPVTIPPRRTARHHLN
jgi:hypothetical protein